MAILIGISLVPFLKPPQGLALPHGEGSRHCWTESDTFLGDVVKVA